LLLNQIANLECVVYGEVRIAFRAVSGHFNLNGVLDQLLVAEAGRASNGFNAARLYFSDTALLRIVFLLICFFTGIAQPNVIDFWPTALLGGVMRVMHIVAASALKGLLRHLGALR